MHELPTPGVIERAPGPCDDRAAGSRRMTSGCAPDALAVHLALAAWPVGELDSLTRMRSTLRIAAPDARGAQ